MHTASHREPHHAFGEVLRRARKDRGLSQERLALDSHLDRTYVSMIERGKRNPSINTIFAIASELGVQPSHLVQETERQLREDAG